METEELLLEEKDASKVNSQMLAPQWGKKKYRKRGK